MNTSSRNLSWGWFFLGLLLSLSVYWNVTPMFGLSVQTYLFLPVLTAWLASRYGTRVLGLLLALGLLSVFDFRLAFGYVYVSFGVPLFAYLLAVCSAAAFATPRLRNPDASLLGGRWRWLKWAVVFALGIAVFAQWRPTWQHDDWFSIGTNVGLALTMAGLMTAIDRGALRAWLDEVLRTDESRWRRSIGLSLAILLMLAFLLFVDFEIDDLLQVSFGYPSASSLPFVLAFALPVFGMIDWKAALVILIAFFAGDWLAQQLLIAVATDPDIPAPLLPSGLVLCVAASLLAVALAPFWRFRDASRMHNRRSTIFLFLALAILLVGISSADYGLGGHAMSILGGVAFGMGLIWQVRGAIGAPLIIMAAYLLAVMLRRDGYQATDDIYDLVNIGLVVFPFAYLGLLSNRYSPGADHVSDNTRSSAGTALTIDISALAAMVRRMDVSATLKSFVVVFAFLYVAQNLASIFSFANELVRYDLIESKDIGFAVAAVLTATVFALTPLAFIVWDWMARQPWGHLAAISGALIGGLGFAIIGGTLGSLGNITLSELEPGETGTHLIAAAPLAATVALLAAWTVTRSRRARSVVGWALMLVAMLLVSVLLYALLADGGDDGERIDAQAWIGLALLIASVAVTLWLFIRAVRHRIALSGERPREMMLGAIQRKRFWTRLAFLAGLPSSLWHARAMITPAFWAFLLARPLVYAGMLALSAGIGADPVDYKRLALGVGLIVGGHLLFQLGKRLAARRIWNPDDPSDKRDPVLFLRSFEDDQLSFRRRWWDLFGRWIDLWSFRRNADEAMIDEIAQYGPVVALGMPGEDKVPFGASRYYSTHDDWQRIVTDTAKRARAIVIAAGDTPGVRWEYELLARENLLDRTLMLFPPTATDRSAETAALVAFANATGIDAHFDMPDSDHPIALLRTDAGTTLLAADEAGASAHLVAVRGLFQRCSAKHLADGLGL